MRRHLLIRRSMYPHLWDVLWTFAYCVHVLLFVHAAATEACEYCFQYKDLVPSRCFFQTYGRKALPSARIADVLASIELQHPDANSPQILGYKTRFM